jgi:hypothetical protein
MRCLGRRLLRYNYRIYSRVMIGLMLLERYSRYYRRHMRFDHRHDSYNDGTYSSEP